MRIIVSICLFLFLLSCQKEPQLQDTDFLIFGYFYGECIGEDCVKYFKLEPNELQQGLNEPYASTFFPLPYDGDFPTLRDQADFDAVNDLIDFLPVQLLEENGNIMGQPDAGDWGGYYVEWFTNGETYSWLIDTQQDNTPDYLHEFQDSLGAKLQLLGF
jgi:hypothetical protein